MQRLGVRLIERHDPEDAIVLGDAMLEKGIDVLLTGRSRPVMFQAFNSAHDSRYTRITSREEEDVLARTSVARATGSIAFFVRGYEAIYNVRPFAQNPDGQRWDRIWSMWVTPKRAIYRALVDARLLPTSVRFHELRWDDVSIRIVDGLMYALHLSRVPPRRKKPIAAFLFNIMRRDADNPRTQEYHFSDALPPMLHAT